jgi:hypothetical protein
MELRLLVERLDQPLHGSITVEGRHWSVTEPYDISNWAAIPEYTCISYVWGSGRVQNPLDPTVEMSNHTLPSLAAAVSNNLGAAFWIDAFCIPTDRQKKQATLERMGFIYSCAKQVVVAFSSVSFAAIEQVARSDQLDDHHLEVLDCDEWVKSVWTYQEVVNSQQLICVCGELPGSTIEGAEFLNRVGYSLQIYKKRHGLDSFDLIERFPRLSALEDLVADWMLAGYMERSALQVMSNMDLRVYRKPTHRLYSMIGAVTDQPSRTSANSTVVDLAELFMIACEEKNDYSFIYSAAPRDLRPGKRWRPVPGCLPSILPWHSWGEAQRVHKDAAGLWLEDIVTLQPSHGLSPKAKEIIIGWMGHPELVESDAQLAERLCRTLRRVGYNGSSEHVIVEGGVFFPLHAVDAPAAALVTIGIRWTLGAPGLLVQATKEGTQYVPGVFAGSTTVKAPGRVLLA